MKKYLNFLWLFIITLILWTNIVHWRYNSSTENISVDSLSYRTVLVDPVNWDDDQASAFYNNKSYASIEAAIEDASIRLHHRESDSVSSDLHFYVLVKPGIYSKDFRTDWVISLWNNGNQKVYLHITVDWNLYWASTDSFTLDWFQFRAVNGHGNVRNIRLSNIIFKWSNNYLNINNRYYYGEWDQSSGYNTNYKVDKCIFYIQDQLYHSDWGIEDFYWRLDWAYWEITNSKFYIEWANRPIWLPALVKNNEFVINGENIYLSPMQIYPNMTLSRYYNFLDKTWISDVWFIWNKVTYNKWTTAWFYPLRARHDGWSLLKVNNNIFEFNWNYSDLRFTTEHNWDQNFWVYKENYFKFNGKTTITFDASTFIKNYFKFSTTYASSVNLNNSNVLFNKFENISIISKTINNAWYVVNNSVTWMGYSFDWLNWNMVYNNYFDKWTVNLDNNLYRNSNDPTFKWYLVKIKKYSVDVMSSLTLCPSGKTCNVSNSNTATKTFNLNYWHVNNIDL